MWYNAFNKPVKIARAGTQLEFFYGADEMRYKQVNSAVNRTTLYIDRLFEKITEGGVTKYRHFINDIAVVTTAVSTTGTSHQIGFTHRDRLGSPVAIVDAQGVLKETHSFDPFGKPRLGNSLDKLLATLGSGLTTRGFTDHEYLDDVQLIHMNGRAYDYHLGRFLSVDSVIQAPGNSQSLNPYSYLMNNPLSGTDPTGYCGKGDQEDSCGKLGVGDVLEATVKITHKPVTGSRLSKTSTKTVTVTNNGKGSVTYGVVGGSTTLQIGGNNGSGGGSATSIGGQESREKVGGPSVGSNGYFNSNETLSEIINASLQNQIGNRGTTFGSNPLPSGGVFVNDQWDSSPILDYLSSERPALGITTVGFLTLAGGKYNLGSDYFRLPGTNTTIPIQPLNYLKGAPLQVARIEQIYGLYQVWAFPLVVNF